MADNLNTFATPCSGGLVVNQDPLTQGGQMPGSALRLINYEPALNGGYRRISGYTNTYGEMPGLANTAVLGVHVSADIGDGIFATRRPTTGSNYLHAWNSTTTSWDTVTTAGSPTMTGVSKVRFESFNWGAPKFAMADGINSASTWDGTTYVQLNGGQSPSAPSLVSAFNNHLFLAGDSSEPYNVYFSAPLDETDWTPAAGAGVINVGFEVVQLKSFRNELYIFGKNNIKRLVGNNIADFQLVTVTANLGCVAPDSVVEFNGDILFLAPDGIRPVTGTDRIGDIELATLSKPIQSIFEDYTANEDLATMTTVVLKKKSQFRLFFANQDSLGIIGAIRRSGQGGTGFEFSQLVGVEVNCAHSGYIGDEEFVIHGDSSGYVYRQEVGDSFNNRDIFSFFQTPFFYMSDPAVRKSFYDVDTYMRSEGEVTLNMAVYYDYSDPTVTIGSDYGLSTRGAAAYYDKATYDTTDIYDGNPSPVERTTIAGSGKSVSIRYVANDQKPSHTIQAITLTYGLGDRR